MFSNNHIQSTGSNLYDDSLTNLSWLHDLNILKRTIPTINQTNVQPSNSINQLNELEDDPNDFNIHYDEQWRMYRNNPQAKPVYSYSQLILLAMKQSGHEKMTLQMIYEWVAENFPYFKKMEPTWQNSIRHNLSLSKWFVKVARTRKETGGKGGFWKLSPDYDRQYSKKINTTLKSNVLTTTKRIRSTKRSNLVPDRVKPFVKNSLRGSSVNVIIKSENNRSIPYVRMPSSLLSPISSPDGLPVVSAHHYSQMNEFSGTLPPSPSCSPLSMPSMMIKQNISQNKLDESDMLLLDAASFDWDAYLYETPNDMDVQPLLSTKAEQDLFNEFNAALTDLTSSAETVTGGESNVFDGFDYPIKSSAYNSIFEDDESVLTVKGHGIKRPPWWPSNHGSSTTNKLPSLEAAFDLKLSK